MPVLATLALLLLGSAKLLAMGDASWQPLVPGATKGPEVAAVHVAATLSQTLLRIPKEAVLPEGRHDVDATLVVLEGELTVEAEGRTFQLVQGSLLELPAGTSHRGRTKWDKKALLLITLAGPWARQPQ
ncbi:MAG TPA: cupin domain-containing protein [Candidatus Polarisedimenticolaceae bacterium]|nr:cupin domain-containing protein [Candidatus Polarisedimenticolaceae bacterium]